jgi:hypothetical protein
MRCVQNPVKLWLSGQPFLTPDSSSPELASSRWLNGEALSTRGSFSPSRGILTAQSSPTLVSARGNNTCSAPGLPDTVPRCSSNCSGSMSRNERLKLQLQIAQRDRTIASLQSTIRNLSSYIRQLEQLNEVPENGSLGGTADSSRRSPVRDEEFTPRMRLNQLRDLNKQTGIISSSPISSSMDDIDDIVQKFLESRDLVGALRRVSYGVYSIGDGPKRISVCIKNNKPLVRSGGGSYLHLDMYLSTH